MVNGSCLPWFTTSRRWPIAERKRKGKNARENHRRIVPASSKATHTTAIAISDQIKRKNPTIETCRWKIARHGEITSAKRGFSTASTPRISREQRRFAVASRKQRLVRCQFNHRKISGDAVLIATPMKRSSTPAAETCRPPVSLASRRLLICS